MLVFKPILVVRMKILCTLQKNKAHFATCSEEDLDDIINQKPTQTTLIAQNQMGCQGFQR